MQVPAWDLLECVAAFAEDSELDQLRRRAASNHLEYNLHLPLNDGVGDNMYADAPGGAVPDAPCRLPRVWRRPRRLCVDVGIDRDHSGCSGDERSRAPPRPWAGRPQAAMRLILGSQK